VAEPTQDPEPPQQIRVAIGVGLRTMRAQPILWATAVSPGPYSFFAGLRGTVYTLFATEYLGLGGALLGVVFHAVGMLSCAGTGPIPPALDRRDRRDYSVTGCEYRRRNVAT
jgi:hypothetical protein